jgi:hypothetical protein
MFKSMIMPTMPSTLGVVVADNVLARKWRPANGVRHTVCFGVGGV